MGFFHFRILIFLGISKYLIPPYPASGLFAVLLALRCCFPYTFPSWSDSLFYFFSLPDRLIYVQNHKDIGEVGPLPVHFLNGANLMQNWLMHDCRSLVIEFIPFIAAFQDLDKKPASE